LLSLHTSLLHSFPLLYFFFSLLRPPPTSPLFPYTTLFRSFVNSIDSRIQSNVVCSSTPYSRIHSQRLSNCPPILYATFRNGCERDRKSTRLNSSHGSISYAVFCLKKKNKKHIRKPKLYCIN